MLCCIEGYQCDLLNLLKLCTVQQMTHPDCNSCTDKLVLPFMEECHFLPHRL